MNHQWLNWVAIVLCCIAAALQSLIPVWVFLALLIPALVLMGISMVLLTRQWSAIMETDNDGEGGKDG